MPQAIPIVVPQYEQQVQPISPLDAAAKAIGVVGGISNIQANQQNQALGNITLQQHQQALKDEQDLRTAAANANGDPDEIYKQLSVINPRAAATWGQQLETTRKNLADQQKTDIENADKVNKMIGQSASTWTDEDSFHRGKAQLVQSLGSFLGPASANAAANQIGAHYDPKVADQLKNESMTAQERIDAQKASLDAANAALAKTKSDEEKRKSEDESNAHLFLTAQDQNDFDNISRLQRLRGISPESLSIYGTVFSPATKLKAAGILGSETQKVQQELGNLPQNFDDAKARLDAIAPPGDKDFSRINSQMTGLLKAGAQNPAGFADALKQATGLAEKVTSARAQEPIKIETAAGTAAAQAGGATGQGLDLMAQQALNGNFSSRNPALLSKVYARAAEMAKEQGLDSAGVIMAQKSAKANTEALDAITKQMSQTEAFSQTANKNMDTLTKALNNVTDLGGPVLNTPIRNLQQKFGDPRVTAFVAAIQPVQSEIAKILSSNTGSGSLTDSARNEMAAAISPGATPAQLKAALDVFRSDIENRRQVYKAQQQDLLRGSVVGGPPQTPPPTTATTAPSNIPVNRATGKPFAVGDTITINGTKKTIAGFNPDGTPNFK